MQLTTPRHRTAEELARGLAHVAAAPSDSGTLELIVRRPAVGERELLDVGELSLTEGLVGDSWRSRPSSRTKDGGPHPDMQLNVINARLSRLVAGEEDVHRALAGDQLHVDLDLSEANLPAGSRLGIGEAVIEVSAPPHRGCAKFSARFGTEALRFANTGPGRPLRLRGLNAKVVIAVTIRHGETVRKL